MIKKDHHDKKATFKKLGRRTLTQEVDKAEQGN